MKKVILRFLPLISILIAAICDLAIPDSALHPIVKKDYYIYFLVVVAGIYAILFLLSFLINGVRSKLDEGGLFYTGAVQIINIINLITSKFALLPVLFFPSLDAVFGVFEEDTLLIFQCIFSSLKLLAYGFAFGGILGFFTGILVGFNKKANYWITRFTKVIGPIPAMAWSPLVLSLFPTSYQAAVFIIALAVWFPVTLMTSSGIQNVKNSYFEVASTLGASTFYKVFRVGVPAALPSIFLGVFNGTVNAFVTLISAEMFGCKIGIGWYLNWTKSMMLYRKVYAGLIVLAGICFILITLLFKFKNHIMQWQKGVIKW